MGYQGGKHLAAPWIAPVVMETNPAVVYEPFCGACSVTKRLVEWGAQVEAADINLSMVLMWQHTVGHNGAAGEDLDEPEVGLTDEEYQRWKHSKDSVWKAVYGCASFGGKWFGGMARPVAHNYPARQVRAFNRAARGMRGRVRFHHRSYLDTPFTVGAVYYLDPPYEDVTRHFGGAFSHTVFWQWVSDLAETGNLVYASSYEAPIGEVVMEKATPLSLAGGVNGQVRTQRERVFRVGDVQAVRQMAGRPSSERVTSAMQRRAALTFEHRPELERLSLVFDSWRYFYVREGAGGARFEKRFTDHEQQA